MTLNLELAEKLIKASEEKAKELNIQMVISILDAGGNLIATHRMDDAWIASVDIAQNKAWTSVALKMPTANLEEMTVPNGSLYGLNTTNDGRIVVFGGGFPLEKDGRVVGAIGASGSSVSDDVEVATAGLEEFNKSVNK